ncbi:tyrosine-type recombinase/integrase [Pseudomonas fluorescens]|uniref:tyrosine-type recombinase/integrase n=1 Tax=Pseudomonas fluorescens TaxID=294 RepID=UPI003F99E662
MMHTEQLWLRASDDFCLPGFVVRGDSPRWRAPGLRALYWPSGKICWQINMYLIFCRRLGLALSTVNTYASELSSLIRFLSDRQLSLFDVADDDLVEYGDWLLLTRKASNNHINRLLLRAVSFFEWAQGPILGKKIVGSRDEYLQITLTVKAVKMPNGILRSKVHHRSMLAASVPRTVHPMSLSVLSRLMDASDKLSKTNFIRRRNRMLLTVLADAGVRREELTLISTQSILDATKSGRLRVNTSKRKGNPEREIPIPEVTIQALNEYVAIPRALHVHKLTKNNPGFIDAGWAFCTRMGGRLAPASVTQLFSDLRVEAGVAEVATAHMLRHRFITLQLITRLKSIGKKRSIGVELLTTILSKLASISGHASIESLWRYMDWAYEEIEHEESCEDGENARAREIVDIMLQEAVADDDTKLIEELRMVLEALSMFDQNHGGVQSVISHSLRGRANRRPR